MPNINIFVMTFLKEKAASSGRRHTLTHPGQKTEVMMSVDVVDNGELHKLWGLL
jgi:hypothetical protein